MPSLIIESGDAGTEIPLEQSPVTVGRDDGSDLPIDADPVSPRHASLREENARWYVKDEGSRFGTFVNHRRVTEQGLRHGDVIELGLGGPTLRFEAEEGFAEDDEEPITLEQEVPEQLREPSGPTTGVMPALPDLEERADPEPAIPVPPSGPEPPTSPHDETTMELEAPRPSSGRLRDVAWAVGTLAVVAAAVVGVRACSTSATGPGATSSLDPAGESVVVRPPP